MKKAELQAYAEKLGIDVTGMTMAQLSSAIAKKKGWESPPLDKRPRCK